MSATPATKRGLLYGVLWFLLAQAPMSFPGVVPANGRYLSLSIFGLALVLHTLVRASFERGTDRGTRATCAVIVLGVSWAVFLQVHLGQMRAASAEAEALRSALLELPGEGPVVVTGAPPFVRNDDGVPLAQVYNWGLADALQPPFSKRGRGVYPVHRRDRALGLAAAQRGVASLAGWTGRDLRGLVAPTATSQPPCLDAQLQREHGAAVLELGLSPPSAERQRRLVVLTSLREQVTPLAEQERRARLPMDAVRSSLRLAPGLPVLVWVEERLPTGPEGPAELCTTDVFPLDAGWLADAPR